MVTGAPLVFFWASLYNGNHSLRQEKISCPVNLRGVGNDFSITFLCFWDTTPTFCKRGGSFCIPADMKRHGEEGRPSTTAERKTKRGLAIIVARAVMVGISLIAAFLARDPDSSVFRVVSFAWAGFGAAFGPVMLMALFWKRSNKWGALAGMVVGGVMVFVWKFLIAPLGGVWAIYELLPDFLCSLVAIVVVSLLTPAPEQSVVQIFEEIRKK